MEIGFVQIIFFWNLVVQQLAQMDFFYSRKWLSMEVKIKNELILTAQRKGLTNRDVWTKDQLDQNLWAISYGDVKIPVKRLCVADLMIAAEPGSGSPIQDHSGSSELELFSTENFDGSGSTSSFQSEIRLVSGFKF